MNDMVIIITNKTTTKEFCDVDETLKQLELSAYNNGENICGLRNFTESLCLKDISVNPKKGFDILVLPDVELDEDYAAILKYFSAGLQTVYVLYHKNPRNPNLPKSQTDFMEKILDQVQINRLYQSHDSNSIYCIELKEIANAIITKNEKDYNLILQRMKARFPDSILEKKLILLHECLHHESAKDSLSKIAWLTQEQQDIVKYLAAQTDNLTEDYIKALTKLRISLLGS